MLRPALRFVLRGVALRLLRVRATYSAATVDVLRNERVIVCSNHVSLRISVKVISGFGERDQGRKVVLRGQEIVA